MTKALSKQTFDLTLPGQVTRTGLVLASNLTIEQWQDVGKRLAVASEAVHWWIGDWLNYGENKYGEMYSQAMDETDFDYDTLKADKWVAERIELVRRRTNLSFAHHREVAALPPAEQTQWLDKAEEHGWTRRELRTELRVKRKAVTFPKGKYRVLYADPPWRYNDERTGTQQSGGVVAQYQTMAIEEICALPVTEITMPDSVLFLWATSPLLPEASLVIGSWGFEYKASFVWDKVRGFNGHYNDVRHELLLVATKGSCLPEIQKLFDSIVIEEKGKHSKKPESFRGMIDALYPSGPRVELFARTKAKGWDVWGNEL